MSTLFRVGNNLITKLTNNIGSTDTSLSIITGDGAKFGAEISRLYGSEKFPYFITIFGKDYISPSADPNREIVKVTARNEDIFTIERGKRGTSGVSHYQNDNIILGTYADEISLIQQSLQKGWRDTEWASPIYDSKRTFTVAGNVTSEAVEGRKLKILFANSGAKYCTIVSSSFSSPNTTITVVGEDLVNETINSVEIDLSCEVEASKMPLIQLKDGLINPGFFSPTYVSATSFTVAGDVTSWLRPGRGLVITFQTSGIKRCIITSLSYNSGTDKTTINVIGDSLVNETITSVLLSLSDLEMVKNYTAWFNSPPTILDLKNKTANEDGDIDLSSYIPSGTTSVLLMIHIQSVNVNSIGEIYIKGKNQTGTNYALFFGQVSFVSNTTWNKNMGEIPVSSDRKIHYWLLVSGTVSATLKLLGYRVGTTIIV